MTARIREAVRDHEGRSHRTFFVASATDPSVWWRVDYAPGEAQQLTCSCPHGRRVHGARLRLAAGESAPHLRPCRHLTAVADRLRSERSAVA